MKKQNNSTLISQLRQVGAEPSEAALLAEVAADLHKLERVDVPHMQWSVDRPSFGWARTLAFAAAFVLVGFVVTALSQAANPGNPFYPLKRITENVAIAIQPSYKGTVMMRRADEVKALVDSHGSSRLIVATVDSYNSELASYKNAQYADLEYCHNVLVQARNQATGANRTTIQGALDRLSTHLDQT